MLFTTVNVIRTFSISPSLVEGETAPYILHFSGCFHDNKLSLFRDFRYHRSSLGLESDPVDVGIVHAGVVSRGRIEFANFSDSLMTVDFIDLSPGLNLSPSKTVLEPMSRSFLSYSFIPDTLIRGGFNYSFTPVLNDETQSPVLIKTVSVNDFSSLSSDERNSSAIPRLKAERFFFDFVPQGSDAEAEIILTNSAAASCSIQAVFAERGGLRFVYPPVLPAQDSIIIKVLVPASSLRVGTNWFKVSIVTDSPLVPYLETFVSGTIY